MDIVFTYVLATLKKKRQISRADLLDVNQTFLALGESRTPMQDCLANLFLSVVNKKYHSTLKKIARAQDETQSLSYHNSTQASREMLSLLLISSLIREGDLSKSEVVQLFEQVNLGMLALSMRYYKAEQLPEISSHLNSRALPDLPEYYYGQYAKNDGLLEDLSEDDQKKVIELLLMTSAVFRETPETFQKEKAIVRNVSDATILPFIGISMELNIANRMRIFSQSKLRVGEPINYSKKLRSHVQPYGDAIGTAYEVFIARMVDSIVHQKGKHSQSIAGLETP